MTPRDPWVPQSAMHHTKEMDYDGFIAQMESGIIYGLTAALYGEITIKEGAVEQSNFHNYHMLRLPECPEIKVHIMPSEEDPGGVGEPGAIRCAGGVDVPAGGTVEDALLVEVARGAVAGDAGAEAGDLALVSGLVLDAPRDVRPGEVVLEGGEFA